MDILNLSKIISYILRHKPEEYGIELEKDGSVSIEELMASIVDRHSAYKGANKNTLEHILAKSSKKRFEIMGDRVRAYYGHSLKAEIDRKLSKPPRYLFHGTTMDVVKVILAEGLKPMNRQNVHLAGDYKTAEIVAKRWNTSYVILEIDAELAYEEGVEFYLGNEDIWLANTIPAKYIHIKD